MARPLVVPSSAVAVLAVAGVGRGTARGGSGTVRGGRRSGSINEREGVAALPTDRAGRRALGTQTLVAYEPGVANPIDPLGGS